uniref:Nonaspanin n=1 Tax=Tanacetum cinerariifolium TaxID=118510 RepID=A0A6L2N1P0_TANCI|nr:nonaspanin [Tanacetum cinerariifolium]
MDLSAFIHVVDPTKVKAAEREHAEEEARLLNSTIGRVVPLLPVAPDHAKNIETGLVTRVKIIATENVIAERPKRPRKKRQAVTDISGYFHPPKKLKGDYRTSGGVATSGKPLFVLKELLTYSMLNVEVGVAVVATLPLVTSSVSATLEHDSGVPTDSIAGLNLRTICASIRFIISLDSSHHSSTNSSGAEGDSIIRSIVIPPVMTEAVVTSHAVNALSVSKTSTKVTSQVHASMFHDSDSAETMKTDAMEFNVGTARQACLNAEVRMRTEYCLSVRKRLESECEKQADLLKGKDDKVENLKIHLLLKETEAAEAACLYAQVSAVEATEKMHATEIDALKQRNVVLENEKDSLDGKVLEGWSYGLGACDGDYMFRPSRLAISHAIETGMQDGLSAAIVHGKERRSLADVAAYNLDAKTDYNSALQRFREVDFPFLSELSSHKNSSVEDIMNLLRLEDQVVMGENSLSFALSVTHSGVKMIRENVMAKRSVPPVTIEDYEIVGMDGPENAQGNVASFHAVEFKMEELGYSPGTGLAIPLIYGITFLRSCPVACVSYSHI